MAADHEASCNADPNFAVICGFFEKFGTACGLNAVDFLDLQEMLENTTEVSPALIDLHVKLIRKLRKSIVAEKWERAVVKICHSYSSQDAWEIERFGYKKSRLSVKLRLLKELLEMQFDINTSFKNKINVISAKDLRTHPLGRDKLGNAYWYQADDSCQIRVYKEDPDEETWALVAKDREGLVSLISSLAETNDNSSTDAVTNEDSNSLEENKPVIDTGQQQDTSNGTDSKKSGDDEDTNLPTEPIPLTMKAVTDNIISPQQEEKKIVEVSGIKEKYKRNVASQSDRKAVESAGFLDVSSTDLKRSPDEEIEEPSEIVRRPRLDRPSLLGDKKKPYLSDDEEFEENDEEYEGEDEMDSEVGEEIVEPLMLVTSKGNGEDNKCENPIVGEEIEEDVVYFHGEGYGRECETGNDNDKKETTEKEPEKSDARENTNSIISPTKNNFKLGTILDTKTEKRAAVRFPPKKSRWDIGNPSSVDGATVSTSSENSSSLNNSKSVENKQPVLKKTSFFFGPGSGFSFKTPAPVLQSVNKSFGASVTCSDDSTSKLNSVKRDLSGETDKETFAMTNRKSAEEGSKSYEINTSSESNNKSLEDNKNVGAKSDSDKREVAKENSEKIEETDAASIEKILPVHPKPCDDPKEDAIESSEVSEKFVSEKTRFSADSSEIITQSETKEEIVSDDAGEIASSLAIESQESKILPKKQIQNEDFESEESTTVNSGKSGRCATVPEGSHHEEAEESSFLEETPQVTISTKNNTLKIEDSEENLSLSEPVKLFDAKEQKTPKIVINDESGNEIIHKDSFDSNEKNLEPETSSSVDDKIVIKKELESNNEIAIKSKIECTDLTVEEKIEELFKADEEISEDQVNLTSIEKVEGPEISSSTLIKKPITVIEDKQDFSAVKGEEDFDQVFSKNEDIQGAGFAAQKATEIEKVDKADIKVFKNLDQISAITDDIQDADSATQKSTEIKKDIDKAEEDNERVEVTDEGVIEEIDLKKSDVKSLPSKEVSNLLTEQTDLKEEEQKADETSELSSVTILTDSQENESKEANLQIPNEFEQTSKPLECTFPKKHDMETESKHWSEENEKNSSLVESNENSSIVETEENSSLVESKENPSLVESEEKTIIRNQIGEIRKEEETKSNNEVCPNALDTFDIPPNDIVVNDSKTNEIHQEHLPIACNLTNVSLIPEEKVLSVKVENDLSNLSSDLKNSEDSKSSDIKDIEIKDSSFAASFNISKDPEAISKPRDPENDENSKPAEEGSISQSSPVDSVQNTEDLKQELPIEESRSKDLHENVLSEIDTKSTLKDNEETSKHTMVAPEGYLNTVSPKEEDRKIANFDETSKPIYSEESTKITRCEREKQEEATKIEDVKESTQLETMPSEETVLTCLKPAGIEDLKASTQPETIPGKEIALTCLESDRIEDLKTSTQSETMPSDEITLTCMKPSKIEDLKTSKQLETTPSEEISFTCLKPTRIDDLKISTQPEIIPSREITLTCLKSDRIEDLKASTQPETTPSEEITLPCLEPTRIEDLKVSTQPKTIPSEEITLTCLKSDRIEDLKASSQPQTIPSEEITLTCLKPTRIEDLKTTTQLETMPSEEITLPSAIERLEPTKSPVVTVKASEIADPIQTSDSPSTIDSTAASDPLESYKPICALEEEPPKELISMKPVQLIIAPNDQSKPFESSESNTETNLEKSIPKLDKPEESKRVNVESIEGQIVSAEEAAMADDSPAPPVLEPEMDIRKTPPKEIEFVEIPCVEQKFGLLTEENENSEHSFDDALDNEDGNNSEPMELEELKPVSEIVTSKLEDTNPKPSLQSLSLDYTGETPTLSEVQELVKRVTRKRAAAAPAEDAAAEDLAGNKKRKTRERRSADAELRRSIEEKKQKDLSSSEEEHKKQGKGKSSEAKEEKKAKKRRKRKLMGLDIPDENAIDVTTVSGVRQSRRIAQIKIKEEAERRKLEEMALEEMKNAQKKKSKKDEDKDYKAEKRKRNKIVTDDEYTVDTEVDSDKKKTKKKRRRKQKPFDESNPWKSSTDSSSSDSHVEEEEEEDEESYYPVIPKSDHEFSPESDLEDGTEPQPLKRARTVRKEDAIEEEEEDLDDTACQKCNKTDHPEWILLCDVCDAGWHCSCLRPALLVIPEGDWHCPPCQHNSLVQSLQEKLQEYDKVLSKKEMENRRKERLAYVGISLANVLPSKEHEEGRKREKGPLSEDSDDDEDDDGDENDKKKRSESDAESGSESSSDSSSSGSSSSSSDSDEPIYQLRQRRQAHSYRFNDYDELINSAIKDEVEAAEQKHEAPEIHGKDMATIVKAEADSEKAPGEAVSAQPEAPPAEDDDSEDEIKPVRKLIGKKKHRKLNSLDISSDDEDSDESFKGSSSDEDDEDFDDLEEASSSSSSYGRKKRGRGNVRRSTRARINRYDKEFINDDSEDSEEVNKRRRRSRSWEETEESEESDNSWGRSKKKRNPKPRKPPTTTVTKSTKKKKAKKKKSQDDSDGDAFKRKKPKIKFNATDDGEEGRRRTRGKKINYIDALGTDSEDEKRRNQVKDEESEDEFILNEEEDEFHAEEARDSDDSTNAGGTVLVPSVKKGSKKGKGKGGIKRIKRAQGEEEEALFPPLPESELPQIGEGEANPIEQINKNLEAMSEKEMTMMMEQEEYATKQLQIMHAQLEKEKRRKELEAKKVEMPTEVPSEMPPETQPVLIPQIPSESQHVPLAPPDITSAPLDISSAAPHISSAPPHIPPTPLISSAPPHITLIPPHMTSAAPHITSAPPTSHLPSMPPHTLPTLLPTSVVMPTHEHPPQLGDPIDLQQTPTLLFAEDKTPKKRGRKPKNQSPDFAVGAFPMTPTTPKEKDENLEAPYGYNSDGTPKKRRGRGKGKKTLEKEAAAAAAAAASTGTNLPSAPVSVPPPPVSAETVQATPPRENQPTVADKLVIDHPAPPVVQPPTTVVEPKTTLPADVPIPLVAGKLGVASAPQPFAQSQPKPSVITRMLQSQPGNPPFPVGHNFPPEVQSQTAPLFLPGQGPPPRSPRNPGVFRPSANHYPVIRSGAPPVRAQNIPLHLYHPMEGSPTGPPSSTGPERSSPALGSPSSVSPLSNKSDRTPPPPPYVRAPLLRFPVPGLGPGLPRHPQLQPPHLQQGARPPYHPGMPPNFHYGPYGEGGSHFHNMPPYGEQFHPDHPDAPKYEDDNGEFGGLVSYFSSQREDDLDT